MSETLKPEQGEAIQPAGDILETKRNFVEKLSKFPEISVEELTGENGELYRQLFAAQIVESGQAEALFGERIDAA